MDDSGDSTDSDSIGIQNIAAAPHLPVAAALPIPAMILPAPVLKKMSVKDESFVKFADSVVNAAEVRNSGQSCVG